MYYLQIDHHWSNTLDLIFNSHIKIEFKAFESLYRMQNCQKNVYFLIRYTFENKKHFFHIVVDVYT